jgi:glycosyltransferase involved in cell wall biosynthesis
MLPRFKIHLAPIYDIWSSQEDSQPTKRALVSYITIPFRIPANDPINIQFSNIGIAHSIVQVLNELGYIVDIIEWNDTKFIPRKHYDLFIGHGGCNWERLVPNLSPEVVKIYFSTGLYWKEHNRREEERFNWLVKRRGVRLPYDRWIHYDEEYANQCADGIICLGNQVAKESYSKFPHVINLNNAAYHDARYEQVKKDFASGRNKFLFFSGGGNIHKGLDLLLEAFTRVDSHLYICQEIRPDFYDAYRNELEHFPNIHLIGIVPIRSQQFYRVVDICNFVISLSCSEGSQGAIVECMHQGLIPVVSRESTVDTADYGVTLSSCSITEIIKVVQDLSRRTTEWCEQMSQRTRKAALTDFSAAGFLQSMKTAIECILTRKAAGINV